LAVMLRIFRLATPRLAMCSCASASHHAERPSWKMLKLFARGVPASALVLSATTWSISSVRHTIFLPVGHRLALRYMRQSVGHRCS
jgi:hypothetical protein